MLPDKAGIAIPPALASQLFAIKHGIIFAFAYGGSLKHEAML